MKIQYIACNIDLCILQVLMKIMFLGVVGLFVMLG